MTAKIRRRKYKTDDFIEAIRGSGGFVSTIANRVGCSWQTAHDWISRYPTVPRAFIEEQETILDMAESVLFQSIRRGDTQDAKWLLSRRGKSRGYGESLDLSIEEKPRVEIDI